MFRNIRKSSDRKIAFFVQKSLVHDFIIGRKHKKIYKIMQKTLHMSFFRQIFI